MSYCHIHKKHYNGITCIECFKEAGERLRKKRILEADFILKYGRCEE
jgi:hypothetical protein